MEGRWVKLGTTRSTTVVLVPTVVAVFAFSQVVLKYYPF